MSLAPRLAVIAAASLALGLAGCSSTSSTAAAPASPAATSAAASPSAEASPSVEASPSEAAADQTITITVKDGKVSGVEKRVKVAKDSTVAIVVTSDVADEIHLHGYDKSADVEKDGTATLTFTADKTGVFEIELEEKAFLLTKLQVQ